MLSKDILDTRDSIMTHNNDITQGKAKIKQLVDGGLSKLSLKVKMLERQHNAIKKSKEELEERLQSDQRTGKRAAAILTTEELLRVKEELADKYSELKIARYEAKNVNMLVEESRADLVRLVHQRDELQKNLQMRQEMLTEALKD